MSKITNVGLTRWQRMHYSWTRVATVGVKGFTTEIQCLFLEKNPRRWLLCIDNGVGLLQLLLACLVVRDFVSLFCKIISQLTTLNSHAQCTVLPLVIAHVYLINYLIIYLFTCS